MSYTYSGNPSASDLDLYRFSIGDTGEIGVGYTQQDDATPTSNFHLRDEEITYILTTYTVHTLRMYHLYTAIANKVAKKYKRSLGPQSEDPTSMYKHYKELAAEFKTESSMSAGISVPVYNKDKIFTKGMHDNV